MYVGTKANYHLQIFVMEFFHYDSGVNSAKLRVAQQFYLFIYYFLGIVSWGAADELLYF